MNALIRFKNASSSFSLLRCRWSRLPRRRQTSSSVSKRTNGEYADTDLETDSAGNIYGTTVLGGDYGGGTVFQLSPDTYRMGARTSCIVSLVAPMEASRTKELQSIATATCTARRLPAGQAVVKAVAAWFTS